MGKLILTEGNSIMNDSLSVEAAKLLIEFISTTNYKLAPAGDGAFTSKDEATTHVSNAVYDSKEPLNVCFDTKQGNYWDSAEVSFDGSEWFIYEHGMGGQSAKGKSIQEAIESFRLKHDSTCKYYPVELIINDNL